MNNKTFSTVLVIGTLVILLGFPWLIAGILFSANNAQDWYCKSTGRTIEYVQGVTSTYSRCTTLQIPPYPLDT